MAIVLLSSKPVLVELVAETGLETCVPIVAEAGLSRSACVDDVADVGLISAGDEAEVKSEAADSNESSSISAWVLIAAVAIFSLGVSKEKKTSSV